MNLGSLMSALLESDPLGLRIPYGESAFVRDVSLPHLRALNEALAQIYHHELDELAAETPPRFAFLVSRFDYDDLRYGHVPRLILYAQVLLECFPDAHVAFIVAGTLKNNSVVAHFTGSEPDIQPLLERRGLTGTAQYDTIRDRLREELARRRSGVEALLFFGRFGRSAHGGADSVFHAVRGSNTRYAGGELSLRY